MYLTKRSPALVFLLATALGCGLLGDPGGEPQGNRNLPGSGVGRFVKQDFYCDAEFVQPFVPGLEDPVDESWMTGEPCMVLQDGVIRVWVERRKRSNPGQAWVSSIHTGVLRVGRGTECRDVDARLDGPLREISFGADPGPQAGAPTVLRSEGLYRMWFTQGDGEAIRYAYAREADCTPADCTHWTLHPEPALVPNQDWERGTVGSPSVVYTAVHHLPGELVRPGTPVYLMYYDGDVYQDRAIGHAWSLDGMTWIKVDPQGNEAEASTPAPAARGVQPVLRADQTNWEFWYPDPSYGSRYVGTVGQPHVIVHRTPLRTILLMYYTGNLAGKLERPVKPPPPQGRDASIGIAYSEDGVIWEKAPSYSERDVIALEINPIMAEKLAIVIDLDKPEESVNVFSTFFIINEAAPAVLELVPNQFFIMLWEQTDHVNLNVAPGLAVPPAEESGYPGSSGIGFAYAGNIPF